MCAPEFFNTDAQKDTSKNPKIPCCTFQECTVSSIAWRFKRFANQMIFISSSPLTSIWMRVVGFEIYLNRSLKRTNYFHPLLTKKQHNILPSSIRPLSKYSTCNPFSYQKPVLTIGLNISAYGQQKPWGHVGCHLKSYVTWSLCSSGA